MRVHLGSDHAGFEHKEAIAAALASDGHEVVDHGPTAYDAQDDYPPFILAAAISTAQCAGELGIVLGGSGNGEQIAANKVRGIRAALAWDEDTAVLARQHNDANVLSLGARKVSVAQGVDLARAFVTTPFSGDPRHARRIAMIAAYEADGTLPSPAASPQD